MSFLSILDVALSLLKIWNIIVYYWSILCNMVIHIIMRLIPDTFFIFRLYKNSYAPLIISAKLDTDIDVRNKIQTLVDYNWDPYVGDIGGICYDSLLLQFPYHNIVSLYYINHSEIMYNTKRSMVVNNIKCINIDMTKRIIKHDKIWGSVQFGEIPF